MQDASSQGLMMVTSLGYQTAPHRQQRQRSLVAEGQFFFLHSWKAQKATLMFPGTLSHLILQQPNQGTVIIF